jgi:hypothetical protein
MRLPVGNVGIIADCRRIFERRWLVVRVRLSYFSPSPFFSFLLWLDGKVVQEGNWVVGWGVAECITHAERESSSIIVNRHNCLSLIGLSISFYLYISFFNMLDVVLVM